MLDTGGDLAYFDGIETVALERRNPTAADLTGVTAKRGALGRRDLALIGSLGLVGVDTLFRVRTSQLAGYAPKAGDYVREASGKRWEVVGSQLEQTGGTLELYVRALP